MLLLGETLARRRLAREVRSLARHERDHGHRAGVVEFGAMHARLHLYEQLARRVEDRRLPLRREGLPALEKLLQEEPPIRDYGPRARLRNERIARILADLSAAR